MIDNTPEEVFNAMNAGRILVAILNKLDKISISTEEFMSANQTDAELSVIYNDETLSFEFSLRDKNE